MVASRNVLVVTLGLALGVGCSNQPPASDPSTATGATPPPTQPAPVAPPPATEPTPPASQPATDPQAGTQTGTTTSTTPSAPPEAPLTDEQIVAVLDAANKKEIDEAQLAQTKGKHKDVKAYARVITQHHTEAKAKQAKLVKKLGITAADSDKSKQLTTETQQAVDQLKALQGPDFDQQFVAVMIQDHQKTLDLLDKRILQDAKNAELKTLIEKDLRPTIEKHLKDAEALAQKLGPAGTGATGATGAGAPGGTAGGQHAAGAHSGNQAGQTGVTAGSPGGQGGVQPPAATPAAGAGAGTKGAGTTK